MISCPRHSRLHFFTHRSVEMSVRPTFRITSEDRATDYLRGLRLVHPIVMGQRGLPAPVEDRHPAHSHGTLGLFRGDAFLRSRIRRAPVLEGSHLKRGEQRSYSIRPSPPSSLPLTRDLQEESRSSCRTIPNYFMPERPDALCFLRGTSTRSAGSPHCDPALLSTIWGVHVMTHMTRSTFRYTMAPKA